MSRDSAVLVVDPDDGCRAQISRLLRRVGYETVQAKSGEDAVAAALERRPSLVLLEVVLPAATGYEICRELREEFGDDLPIVFISGARIEALDRVAGLLLGADDYIVKPFNPSELVARVRRFTDRLPSGAHPPRASLTNRELEVLRLLVTGLTQRDIARRLYISPKTVGKHIEHILAKLGVHSRTQAVSYALLNHLV
jgi:DNA-binding NarL/FixJ family response regulator